MLKDIFMYPSKNLTYVIPVAMVLGFLLGIFGDLSQAKVLILPLTFLMIYPNMVGVHFSNLIQKKYQKLLWISLGVNFLIIPMIAFLVGSLVIKSHPQLFIGLMMISVFPTSGMTISWTSLSKGNVSGAVGIVTISLLISAVLAPVYLSLFIGNLVTIHTTELFITVIELVVVPLLLGYITYRLLLRSMPVEDFRKKIKPILPSFSVWSMLLIIVISMSLKAKMLLSNPSIIVIALLIIFLFYVLNYLLSTFIGKLILNEKNTYALVYGTVMRNLSIALGFAVASFGSETVLLITLAYLFQIQSAPIYKSLMSKMRLLKASKKSDILGFNNE